MKVMLGPIGLLMGKEIPNLLWLTNPVNTSMLMFKSFFPPSGEGESSSPPPKVEVKDTLKGEVGGKTPPPPKSNKDEVITDKTIKSDLSTITSDGKTFPKGLSGPMETFGGKGGSTYSDTIDSISDFATYEESDGSNEILLAPSSSTGGKTQGGNQVVKEKIVQVAVDTSDPYEVLYKG